MLTGDPTRAIRAVNDNEGRVGPIHPVWRRFFPGFSAFAIDFSARREYQLHRRCFTNQSYASVPPRPSGGRA